MFAALADVRFWCAFRPQVGPSHVIGEPCEILSVETGSHVFSVSDAHLSLLTSKRKAYRSVALAEAVATLRLAVFAFTAY